MSGGSQDAVCEGATGSAELIGSQLTLRSSSRISQASYDDSMPADLRLMLGTAANSDEDDGEAPPSLAIDGDAEAENDEPGHGQGDAPAAPLDVMDVCCICKRPTGETDIICEQCSAGVHVA